MSRIDRMTEIGLEIDLMRVRKSKICKDVSGAEVLRVRTVSCIIAAAAYHEARPSNALLISQQQWGYEENIDFQVKIRRRCSIRIIGISSF